jgi:hypothetical protein
MTFDLVQGSGNSVMSTVRVDSRNANADVWWCEGKQEYHWMLVWEDSSPYGTHMHSGTAPTKAKARADIVKTIIWTEDTWPRLEYFENNW